MKIEQIKKYKQFIELAIDVYWFLLGKEVVLGFRIDDVRDKFSENGFKKEYDLFENELFDNMRICDDDDIIAEYINSQFSDFVNHPSSIFENSRSIFNNEYELDLLFSLQKGIIQSHRILTLMSEGSYYGSGGEPLLRQLRRERLHTAPITIEKTATNDTESENSKPAKDSRFDFAQLKSEVEEITDLFDKIKLIKKRMHELSAWEIQYDEMNHSRDFESYYIYSTKYYPNFRELCELEINHIEEEIKLEERRKKSTTQQPVVKTVTLPRQKLQWTNTSREFVETFHRLIQNKKISLNGNHDLEPIARVLLETFDIPKGKGAGFVNEESMLTYFRKEHSGDLY